MKQTVPLLVTAAGGFALIVAFFIPATQSWGEVAAIWFDILAAIAFILGGGNLVANHLKKISDHAAGWAYSAITLAAFFVTLAAGLFKIGSAPNEQQEFYGQRFAPLSLEQFPLTYTVEGKLPEMPFRRRLPDSVAGQLAADRQAGTITFHGWMNAGQRADLKGYQDVLAWQATVERLYEKAQPPEALRGKAFFHADHLALAFTGHMREADRQILLALADTSPWLKAVDALYDSTGKVASVKVEEPPRRDFHPETITPDVAYDCKQHVLEIVGPMSISLRDRLARQFPVAKPLSSARQSRMLERLSRLGPLSEKQEEAFHKSAAIIWNAEQLVVELNLAGEPAVVPKSAREMLAEKLAGVEVIEPTKIVGQSQSLNQEQIALIGRFAQSEMSADELVSSLKQAGPFSPRQASALRTFLDKQPTAAARDKELAFALLRAGPLNQEQQDELLGPYRRQIRWRRAVGKLFVAAHCVKFPWAGEYSTQGTMFWWLYEYAFKPLTATMFAMLAFYVASAAFRAFRAKNLEAVLLLGTAFIILLGRTFAGVYLTAWLPESLSFLRIDRITITIMQWFNTPGNRAIMIGIALGIASMSLKVLLAVDRSYLGGGED